ncbi:MAG: potassium channel family protein [Planctomycetota bacterium]
MPREIVRRTGDWPVDPDKHGPGKKWAWAHPSVERVVIGTDADELKALADAIVRGATIWRAEIEDLRALVEAVQAHPDAVLQDWVKEEAARPGGKGTYERIRVIGVTRPGVGGGCESVASEDLDVSVAHWDSRSSSAATRLRLRSCVVKLAWMSGLKIRCSLEVVAWFVHASFEETVCGDGASFFLSNFATHASFHRAKFGDHAWFQEVVFAGQAYFRRAEFGDRAYFSSAVFGGPAFFDRTVFGERGNFRQSTFCANAYFESAVVGDEMSFSGSEFRGKLSLGRSEFGNRYPLRSARLRGEIDFVGTELDHGLSLRYAELGGILKLTHATLRRGLAARDAKGPGLQMGPDARVAINNLLLLDGATLEFSIRHLRRVAPNGVRSSPLGSLIDGVDAWLKRQFKLKDDDDFWWNARPLAGIASWFVLHPRGAFVLGEDSGDPDPVERAKALERAAEDYELLASNYRMQSATDAHEDWCRWRAHELRRVSWFARTRGDLATAFRPVAIALCLVDPPKPDDSFKLKDVPLRFASWIAELIALTIMVLVKHILLDWLIQRTCFGYLLHIHRIVATALVSLAGFAIAYSTLASPDTITHSGLLPEEVMSRWDGSGSLFGLDVSALYFSVTTFVTLGYGDFAPLGLFKLLTGLEALLGVTLIALFTVAWGRKMVR